jgi:hypothetical protein
VAPNRQRPARPPVESAIGALNKQQHEALERATFVGMNAEEKSDYDDRAQRINRLQRARNTEAAETNRLKDP